MTKTWKEFKEAVEAEGVKDDHKLLFIDWDGWGEISVYIDEDNEVTIC